MPMLPLPEDGLGEVLRRDGASAWPVGLLLLRRRRCALTSGILSDIMTFHSLYWILMLEGKIPDRIVA
jgi:hypothetical protein